MLKRAEIEASLDEVIVEGGVTYAVVRVHGAKVDQFGRFHLPVPVGPGQVIDRAPRANTLRLIVEEVPNYETRGPR